MNILILGGASYDSIIYRDEFPAPIPQTIHHCEFNESVGSTGIGKAANLCYLGFETTLHVLIGKDIYGDKIREFFRDKPLQFLYDINPNGTERHVNLMNARGERISIFVNSTADEPPLDYQLLEIPIEKADLVVLNIVNYARNFIPLLKKHKKEVWTDLHDYDGSNTYHQDFIRASDYVFMSSDNLIDYRCTMNEIISTGKKLVVCTHGKKGATALTQDGKWLETNILTDFKLIDSNGAGDAFFSGFLYGYSKHYNLEKCMLLGHILAGLCISSPSIAGVEISTEKVEALLTIYIQNQ